MLRIAELSTIERNIDMKKYLHFAQILQLLMEAAGKRETLTYGQICARGDFGIPQSIGKHYLEPIHQYCKDRKLPHLPVLVVNKETGEPGDAIPISKADIDDETRRVFRHDWEKEKLPTLEDIETTYRRANTNDDGSDL